MASGNLRRESLEHVQVCVDRFTAVEVEPVFAFPAKRLARNRFESGEIDPSPAEDLVHVRAEIFTNNGDDPHVGEKRRGDGKVSGGAADNPAGFAEWSL